MHGSDLQGKDCSSGVEHQSWMQNVPGSPLTAFPGRVERDSCLKSRRAAAGSQCRQH